MEQTGRGCAQKPIYIRHTPPQPGAFLTLNSFERLAAAVSARYRIEREIGAGGMATVYLAEDLKHERKVAIKVLRAELSAVIGAERFLREIKTIAGLQHPHILGLIDSGEFDGTAYYVMPYVEGESLRDHLQREKQLPIAEATRIAREVAGALDYAHRRGVIHRDIKPENILLHDGQALVADFGIALAVSSAGGTRMTETGMSLGTPHYMSPEQAMGEREITARSDVYALGCVLYEMLVGEPPFTGPTAQSVVAKVMTDEPRPPSQLRKTIPLALERVTLVALAKLPADRYASAAALSDALTASLIEPAVTSQPGQSANASIPRRRAMWIAGGAVAGAAVVGLAVLFMKFAAPAVTSSQTQITFSGRATTPAFSPDGRFVAYIERRCDPSPAQTACLSIMLTEVGGVTPVEIVSGARDLSPPRWSADGASIVFGGQLAEGRAGLFAVPRLGGTPRWIYERPSFYDTHGSADSVAVVVVRDSTALLSIVELSSGKRAGTAIPFPIPLAQGIAWSPDGRYFATTGFRELFIVRRDGVLVGTRKRANNRATVRWSADGRRVYTFEWTAGQSDNLVEVLVAADGTFGARRQLLSQIPTLLQGQFDLSRSTGRLIVGSGAEFTDIWSFDLSGASVSARRLTQGTSWYGPPTLSPDGRSVFYLRADPLGNSFYRNDNGVETALTAERQMVNGGHRWSPVGRVAAFETFVDSATLLTLYDAEAMTTRIIPMAPTETGWFLSEERGILWMSNGNPRVWLSDAKGNGRRQLTSSATIEGQISNAGRWQLSGDGLVLAVLRNVKDSVSVRLIPLDGTAPRELATAFRQGGTVAFAGWPRGGSLYLALTVPGSATTELLSVDPLSGAVRREVVLPRECEPQSVAYVPSARRAVCMVPDRRADLMLIEGVGR